MKAASLEINNPNHGKLSKIWVQMGELLESENMKKTEISTKIKRMIESSMMKQLPRRTNKRDGYNHGRDTLAEDARLLRLV